MPPKLTCLEVGTFKGFGESGLEFRAELVAPYHTEYRPSIGEYVLVALSEDAGILGRVTRFYPMGALSSGEGEEYLAEMRRRSRPIPEDLKETRLRYNVSVKLLGALRQEQYGIAYQSSIRQLPHLGATVATLSVEALRFVCSLGTGTGHRVTIGHHAMGDAVRDTGEIVTVAFDLDRLKARRTYVFARAGYGKSNLIKLMAAQLYERPQDTGLLIFDPEGEYAFPDRSGRPGLASVPHLADKIVVFTNRRIQPPLSRWVAGNVRLDLRHLRPADVVNMTFAESKQELVFANVLRGLDSHEWYRMVDLLASSGYRTNDNDIKAITGPQQDVVVAAIKNNLVPVISALHSAESPLVGSLRSHLKEGRVVIVDVSLLSSGNSYKTAGLLLNELFARNQENFIAGSEGDVVPVIAVVEEAQSVIPRGVGEGSPFVAWVKEGRKYGLGAVMVTQQPGALAPELVSQGDNFFAFHLLSAGDVRTLQQHNAHYSDDVLASILNEPIRGNAYLWSAPDQPFVLPARILNFESYVNERAQTESIPVRTAAELRREAEPRLTSGIDRLVNEVLDQPNVVMYQVVQVDGKNHDEVCAVNKWNLLFATGKSLETAPDLMPEFGRKLPDGKTIGAEEAIVESLKRVERYVGQGRGDDEKEYFLISLDGRRPPRPGTLRIRTAG